MFLLNVAICFVLQPLIQGGICRKCEKPQNLYDTDSTSYLPLFVKKWLDATRVAWSGAECMQMYPRSYNYLATLVHRCCVFAT